MTIKPWEETWTVSEYRNDEGFLIIDVESDTLNGGDGGIVCEMGTCCANLAITENEQRSRAKLAAQAPAMARLLFEWLHDGPDAELRSMQVDQILRAAGVIP